MWTSFGSSTVAVCIVPPTSEASVWFNVGAEAGGAGLVDDMVVGATDGTVARLPHRYASLLMHLVGARPPGQPQRVRHINQPQCCVV